MLPRAARYRVLMAVALVAVAFGVGLVVGGTFESEPKEVAVAPVTTAVEAAADASVFAGTPDENRGSGPELRVDSSPVARAYVRFDLSRLTGDVTSAKLALEPLAENPVGLAVRLVPAGWSESEITYATAPKPGARVALTGPLSAGVRTAIDVTRFVRGRRELDLALVAVDSQSIALASREQAGLGPQLTVVTKGGKRPPLAAQPSPGQSAAPPAPTSGIMAAGPTRDPLIAAAGDIACEPTSAEFRAGKGTPTSCRERAVSDMLLRIRPNAVLPLGDNQYECGHLSGYRASYDRSWGRLRAISRPVLGNHEYGQACGRNYAAGYFRYFGAVAGPNRRGWYSYNLGSWHLIALNSQCSYGRGRLRVGGCEAGSGQERWLRRDLAAHPRRCTLAYWHEPRFSSGQHGNAQQMARIWNVLARARADIVLSGHNHSYERFDPIGVTRGVRVTTAERPNFQQPVLDAAGIREFVVGTGGKNHYPFEHAPLRGEVERNDNTFGFLLLRLRPRGYSWRFVPEPGKTFTDSGSGSCS